MPQVESIQPRWLRTKDAARYASIGAKRLKRLATDPACPISGCKDPDSERGDWIFDRLSLDEYRLTQTGQGAAEAAALDVFARAGLG